MSLPGGPSGIRKLPSPLRKKTEGRRFEPKGTAVREVEDDEGPGYWLHKTATGYSWEKKRGHRNDFGMPNCDFSTRENVVSRKNWRRGTEGKGSGSVQLSEQISSLSEKCQGKND